MSWKHNYVSCILNKLKTSMSGISLLFLLCFVISCNKLSYAVDMLNVTESLRDGDTISSAGGTFELGFFSPGNSTNRYVGIWYKDISNVTVWVANRNFPLANRLGVLKLVRNPISTLIILDGVDLDTNNTIWSCLYNVSTSGVLNPILQLLDSGNLVVRDGNVPKPGSYHWQSFDYPADTVLPGMKLGINFKTGFETYLSSWKSTNDPSPGDYTYHFDPTGYPQLIIRKGSVDSYRFGSYNGLFFSGALYSAPPTNYYNFTFELVINEMEVSYSFDLHTKSIMSQLKITPGGIGERSRITKTQGLKVYFSRPEDNCDMYSLCGAYGTCNIVCRCLDKFVPRNEKEWEVNDGSSGCVRMKSLDCKTDGFRKYSGLKLPDTRSSWYNTTMNLYECEAACLNNCSCMAYATLNIVDGRGCLLWFGDLVDMKDLSESYQDLYVRMASSESDHTVLKSSSSGGKINVIIKVAMPLLISTVLLALSLVLYCWRKKRRSQGRRRNMNNMQTENMELQLFALPIITKATKNFSASCKLGEGGFGPVYKLMVFSQGILDDGQEIAVKRLSKTSGQGLKEFKNEVVCIAKLQHRNLVKLLGYNLEDDEMMLIYEYMPNNSLHSIIFDANRRNLLDWPKRYHIINGIARGLLYLHQDSRLRIIHRDLKASNILLDSDMNPKISDFGLARRFKGNEMGADTRMVVGTYGYMSPEYAVHGLFSVKSDVFSFGVLVLEIVSGKKNRGFFEQDHSDNLIGHAWRLYKEDRTMELIDAPLLESISVLEALRLVQVGLLCVQHSPVDRPIMSSVVLLLAGEGTLPQPKQPGFFTQDNIQLSVNEVTITHIDGR